MPGGTDDRFLSSVGWSQNGEARQATQSDGLSHQPGLCMQDACPGSPTLSTTTPSWQGLCAFSASLRLRGEYPLSNPDKPANATINIINSNRPLHLTNL